MKRYIKDLLSKKEKKEMTRNEFLKETRTKEIYRYFTEEESFEAVKNYGHALQYVKNQTNEICLEAVKNYGDALQYVKLNFDEEKKGDRSDNNGSQR